MSIGTLITCLNPCFSGTYSRRNPARRMSCQTKVLILVLVEHTLGVYGKAIKFTKLKVLILVLVEHTLGGRS